MKKSMKTILTVGAVIIGGYFLYKTIAPMGIFSSGQDVARNRRMQQITLYPSMALVGGPYPSPSPFRNVNVF